jgi:hypothetical protein
MTPQERRGKRLFLVLATLIVLEKLAGVGLTLSGGLAEVRWLKSVAQPLGFAIAVAFLWQGDVWLRWLVGVACVLSGGLLAFVSGRVLVKLAGVTPPEATGYFMQVAGYPIGLVGAFGLLYVLAGLLFLFSPGMRAFFRYQREGPRVWIESAE